MSTTSSECQLVPSKQCFIHYIYNVFKKQFKTFLYIKQHPASQELQFNYSFGNVYDLRSTKLLYNNIGKLPNKTDHNIFQKDYFNCIFSNLKILKKNNKTNVTKNKEVRLRLCYRRFCC